MTDEQASARARALGPVLGCGVIMAGFVVSAGLFLPHQSIWIDETTQLSGLTLSPVEVARWLTDSSRQDFGVPGDRMPPLSYWLGWAWAALFGLNETSLRWFGVVCAAPAVGIVFVTAYRAFGALSGWAAGLFFALSPNVCYTAVEIRAYPLFLLTSAAALYCFMQLVTHPEGGRRGTWTALVVWLVLGIYVHFFAVVLAGALVSALLVLRYLRKQSIVPVVAAAVLLAVCAVVLVPFIRGSAGISGDAEERNRVREVAQLLYRLVAHPAMTVYPAAVGVALMGAVVLGVIGLLLPATQRTAYLALVGSLTAGLAVSIAANFAPIGFTAAKVSYATWALPAVCVALSAGLAIERRWLRGLAGAAVLLLLAGDLAGMVQLWAHGEYFAHGPHKPLEALISGFDRSQTAIIHDEQSDDYPAVYYPLRYAGGAGLAQFKVAPEGRSVPLGLPLRPGQGGWLERLSGYSHLVVVRSRQETAAELAEQVRHGDQALGVGKIVDMLEATGQWKQTDHRLFVALVTADVVVLERVK